MTHAHGYKTLVSKDDIISSKLPFARKITPNDDNFHELLVLTGYTIKKGYFHDRKKWWILIFQTYIYVAWWFSPRMSGYFAVIPVSNTSWVDEE